MSEIRLIDANALKEYMDRPFWEKWEWEFIRKCIDNAPTVEINDKSLEIARKSIELGRNVGKLEGKLERPQGEWIDYDNTFYKCPECGYLLEKCCPQCQNKVVLPIGGAS